MSNMIKHQKRKVWGKWVNNKKEDVFYVMNKYAIYTYNQSLGGGVYKNGDDVYLFYAQKVRRKCEHIGKTGRTTISEPIRCSHWVLNVYKFDYNQIVSAKQFDRTFKIVLK